MPMTGGAVGVVDRTDNLEMVRHPVAGPTWATASGMEWVAVSLAKKVLNCWTMGQRKGCLMYCVEGSRGLNRDFFFFLDLFFFFFLLVVVVVVVVVGCDCEKRKSWF